MTSPATIFTVSFTDIYGVEHSAAKLFVSNIGRSTTTNFNEKAEFSNQSTNVNYQLRFWHDDAARLDGAKTQVVTSKTGQTTFYINAIDADVTMVELEALCEQHFIDSVLPTLNQTPAV